MMRTKRAIVWGASALSACLQTGCLTERDVLADRDAGQGGPLDATVSAYDALVTPFDASSGAQLRDGGELGDGYVCFSESATLKLLDTRGTVHNYFPNDGGIFPRATLSCWRDSWNRPRLPLTQDSKARFWIAPPGEDTLWLLDADGRSCEPRWAIPDIRALAMGIDSSTQEERLFIVQGTSLHSMVPDTGVMVRMGSLDADALAATGSGRLYALTDRDASVTLSRVIPASGQAVQIFTGSNGGGATRGLVAWKDVLLWKRGSTLSSFPIDVDASTFSFFEDIAPLVGSSEAVLAASSCASPPNVVQP